MSIRNTVIFAMIFSYAAFDLHRKANAGDFKFSPDSSQGSSYGAPGIRDASSAETIESLVQESFDTNSLTYIVFYDPENSYHNALLPPIKSAYTAFRSSLLSRLVIFNIKQNQEAYDEILNSFSRKKIPDMIGIFRCRNVGWTKFKGDETTDQAGAISLFEKSVQRVMNVPAGKDRFDEPCKNLS